MEINEIKKALYKQKPKATKDSEDGESFNYSTKLEDSTVINFKVSREEMGEKPFDDIIGAQLLIRWIV